MSVQRAVNLDPHVVAAIREIVRQEMAEYLPAGGDRPPAGHDAPPVNQQPSLPRTANVRGVRVHLDGPTPITFARHRKSPCPSCNRRLQLNEKIVGLERVDSPDLLLWVCWRCAERLRRT